MKKLLMIPAIVLLCSFTTSKAITSEMANLETIVVKSQNTIIWGEWSEWSDSVRSCGSRNRIGYNFASHTTVVEFQDRNCLPGNDDQMHDPDGPM
jgi:hypothetical protein